MASMETIDPGLLRLDPDGGISLLAGRRPDGGIVFPLPDGESGCRVEALPRQGTLWSWTVQRFRPKSPPYAGAEDQNGFQPYAVGYVELAGQVIVESRIETDDFARLSVGMPMRLKLVPFRKAGGDVLAYAFEPAA